MAKPKVLITSRLPDTIVAGIEPYATVVQGTDPSKGMARSQALELVGDISAIINQNELKIDQQLLDLAPTLRIVANSAAGFDNMSIEAMRQRKVWGTNCPESFAADTATHTISLLLALTRRILDADRYVRSGEWKDEGWMPGGRWDGVSLEGRRLGLVGYGNIGRHVARRATAFGMTVRHYTRSGTDEPGWLPLDEILHTSDVVSLHCPLNDSTRHLIDAKAFATMKPGAILLNVSRGPVVKETDLVDALKEGRLGGAGLDVFEFEPDVSAELFPLTNVVLSPHMGGCTIDARLSALRLCVENVISVLRGNPPKTPVFAF